MKNRDIEYSRQAARIYRNAYKPSYNVFRFLKCIVGAMVYGSSTVSYVPSSKRIR